MGEKFSKEVLNKMSPWNRKSLSNRTQGVEKLSWRTIIICSLY